MYIMEIRIRSMNIPGSRQKSDHRRKNTVKKGVEVKDENELYSILENYSLPDDAKQMVLLHKKEKII